VVTLALEDVRVALGGRAVVRGVSAQLESGALVGVLGPNGAGKSTLVRALLGLVPCEGRVAIDEVPVASLPRAAVARRIAYLPQGQTLHWPLTVERLVALGRLPHLGPLSRPRASDQAAVARAMALAEVEPLAHRIATELSGGERARVLLARALAVEAPVLVADEPLASLDPEHQLHGMELLRAQARSGALVLAVLHDLALAARFCDRVLVLHEGRLVGDGAPADVLTPELLAAVYRVRVAPAPDVLIPVERLAASSSTQGHS
jgi:iron complex transport system ATP-binding protein